MVHKIIKLYFFLITAIFSSTVIADDVVTVSPLAQISLDEIGVLNENNGSLGNDLWNNSNYKFALSLLKNMPTNPQSDVVKNLNRRLLLTSAIPPLDSTATNELFSARLKILAKLNESSSIGDMMEKVPPARIKQQMEEIYLASLFIDNNYKKACSEADRLIDKYNSLFIRHSLIICSAEQNKQKEVDLAVNLLKEEGKELPAHISAIIKIMSDGDHEKAMDLWRGIIKTDNLSIDKKNDTTNSFDAITKAPLSRHNIIKWLQENKDLPTDRKLAGLADFYNIIESLGVLINKQEWEQFVLAALGENATIPENALVRNLDLASANNSKGEVVLLTSIALGNKTAKEISGNVLNASVRALNSLGMKKEAANLAAEGLF